MKEPGNNTFSFGEFEVDAEHRLLLKTGAPVTLKPKTFDLLLALVENHGRILTKNELLDKVWENQFVEENNLTVHVAALRKALGETKNENKFIVTVPGKGYQFVAEMAPPTNGDIVVERHTLEKIVVEEDIVDSEMTHERALLRSRFRPSRRIAIVAAAVILAVIGGGYALRQQFGSAAIQPFSNHNVRQLTTNGKVVGVAISPDTKVFAFTVMERGEFSNSLRVRQSDGGTEIILRPADDKYIRAIQFAPDGKSVFYVLTDAGTRYGELYRVPALGGVSEKIMDQVSAGFSIAPDGEEFAYIRPSKTSPDRTTIAIVPIDRKTTGRDVDVIEEGDANISIQSPAFSPDGTKIAVVSHEQSTDQHSILISRFSDGYRERVPVSGLKQIVSMIWQRNSSGFIVNALGEKDSERQIWHIPYPDGIATKISKDLASYLSPLSLSADGNSFAAVQSFKESNIWLAPAGDLSAVKQISFSGVNGVYGWDGFAWMNDDRIVFSGGASGSVTLSSITKDGEDLKQITSSGFRDTKPTASINSSRIYFQSNRSGQSEIWQVNSDGSGLKQLTDGGGNSAPHVTADGRWVVYISERDKETHLMRISTDGGKPSRITDNVTSADPRVSPDGKFIACGYPANDKSKLFAIVGFEDGKLVKTFEAPETANLNQSLRWTQDGKTITFRDWVDGAWQQDISGGNPRKIGGLPEEKLYNFDWSPSGQFFAYSLGRETKDAVIIQNANW